MADLDAIFDSAHGIQSDAAPSVPAPSSGVSLDDIFDRAHSVSAVAPQSQAIPSLWSDPIDALTSYDWWTTRPDGSKSGLIGPVMAAGQGLTFGTMDEIAAGGNALLDRVFSGVPLSEAYDQRLEQARGGLKEYQDSSPGQAFAIELLGAANMPIKSKIAEKTGIGAKTVQAMKEGGTLGALYGYGSGEGGAWSRAKDAALGGTIGAGAGGVMTPAIEGGVRGVQMLADKLAEKGITYNRAVDFLADMLFSGSAESQRGSFSNRPTGAKTLTPEELYLARRLKNVPANELDRAAAELSEAESRGVPLYLQEALGDRGVMNNANLVATQPSTSGLAGRAIEARTAATRDRMSNLLSGVSDEIDPYTGAERLQKAGEEIVKSAEDELKAIGQAVYQPAYRITPTIDDPRLVELINSDKYLRDEIRSLQNTAEYSNLPQNATELLVNSRSGLNDRVKKLAEKEPNLSRVVNNTYKKLNRIILDNAPEVRAGDALYAKAAQKIDELNSTFLGYLNKLGPDKIDNVTQLLDRPPARISALRDKFIDAGLEQEWNAGVRSVLDLKLMGMKTGQNMADRLAGVPEMEKQIRAALGDKADDVLRGLFFEDKIAKGKNAYAVGSQTQMRQAEGRDVKQAASLLKSIGQFDYKGVIAKLFDEGMPDELAQGLADIYFNPTRGKDSLTRVASLLDDYARNRRVADAVAKGGTLATTRGSAMRASDALDLGTIGMRGATDAEGNYSTWQQVDADLQRQNVASRSEAKAPSSPPEKTGSEELPRSKERLSSPATQDKAAENPKLYSPRGDVDPVSYTENDNLFNDLFQRADMRDIKDVEAEIDQDAYLSALYETESGRNPKAKNPKSTASGGFQFIRQTAKALELEDPFDLEQSLTAVRKLTDEHKRLFGDDPAVLYSAHYLGSPLLRKLQRGDALTVKEQEIVNGLLEKALPRFLRIYKKVADRDTNSGGGQVTA